MTMTSNTDFRELYFEHKHMEKILAEPSFTSLHYLLLRLKANASSVPCTLGGGAHGYVGMLLSPQAYASLSNIPFDEPLHPGRLVIPPGSTQYEIAHIKSTHENDLTIFQEYNLMQRALISQVCEAVDPQYTAALRNRITGQISANCREILLYLFRIYGKVTPSQLVSEEDAVKKLTYDTSIPIDGIFNSIEDLQELAELSGVPYTPSQIVNLGFIIMNSHRMLRSDVRKWIRKPAVEKTWAAFKLHFTQAHIELRETAASADEMGFHSASALVDTIVDRLRDEVIIDNPHHNPPIQHQPPPADIPVPPPPAAEQASAATLEGTALTTYLTQLTAQMATMQAQLTAAAENPPYRPRGPRRDRERGREHGRNRDRRNRDRDAGRAGGAPTGSYCHTHGNCAHTGANCRTPGPNHIAAATFSNMQGGSTRNCT